MSIFMAINLIPLSGKFIWYLYLLIFVSFSYFSRVLSCSFFLEDICFLILPNSLHFFSPMYHVYHLYLPDCKELALCRRCPVGQFLLVTRARCSGVSHVCAVHILLLCLDNNCALAGAAWLYFGRCGLMVCRQWLPRGEATLYSCPFQLGHMWGGAGATLKGLTKGVVEQGGSSGECWGGAHGVS